ncbi:M14 family zinc carboxypeptidase [Sutcliffiella horikoshii]|uniref:M14 family zinc carboxypeptidase n=1 Tax=Sutcliffiella horikoshii TaxID=79883 RepID=UPI001CFD7E4A|nr:M14 family zinc carboxypeptidase [Sutcliffiella horikoshii]
MEIIKNILRSNILLRNNEIALNLMRAIYHIKYQGRSTLKKTIILLSVLVLMFPSFSQAISGNKYNESIEESIKVNEEHSEKLNETDVSEESNEVDVSIENQDLGNEELNQEFKKTNEDSTPETQEEHQEKEMITTHEVKLTSLTADEYYQLAINQSSYSATLEAFIKGFKMYPDDERFTQGINESARSLLDWASVKQQVQSSVQTARVRYEFILTAPVLNETITKETKYKLNYARLGETIYSPNRLYDMAKNEKNVSPRFSYFVEGYNLYPLDQRFSEGIESSSKDLVDWATIQHSLGNIDSAIVRYDLLLSSPFLDKKLKEEVELKFEMAMQGKRMDSSDKYVQIADNEQNSSAKLNAYIEGYKFYPRDQHIINGIYLSSESLFNWASSQHELGNIDTARVRYELILTAPLLSQDVRQDSEKNLKLAREGIIIVNPDTLFLKAKNEQNSSAKLKAFIKGYNSFPDDQRFIDGINSSARSLLDWATKKHAEGNIDSARVRYELIISAPMLKNATKNETEIKLEYVMQNKALPSINKIIKDADSEVNSSAKLNTYITGLLLYPNNESLKVGLNSSARELLNWATIKHSEGNLITAKLRYELILTSKGLNSFIESETETRLQLADKGVLLPTANKLFEIATNETTSSGKLMKFEEGLKFYPTDKRLIDGINETALSLFNWTVKQHQVGDFDTAIHRYNLIISRQGIKSSILRSVKSNLALANKGLKPITIERIVNAKVQNYTHAQMQNDINKLELMYPGLISQEVIGKSLDGKNIIAVKLGNGKTEVLFNGSAHAREHMTTNLLMKMIDEYAYAFSKNLYFDGFNVREVLNRTTIWFIPMTNPDGVTLVQLGPDSLGSNVSKKAIEINGGSKNFTSWKANARGVDLNRNYPTMWRTVSNNPGRPSESHYKGPVPLSEPESQTIYKFILSKNFKTLVDYHSSGEVLYARLPGHIENLVSRKTGYSIIDETNFTSGGDLPTWFTLELGMPGLTPEISHYVGSRPVPLSNWDSIWKKNNSVGLIVADEAYRNRR